MVKGFKAFLQQEMSKEAGTVAAVRKATLTRGLYLERSSEGTKLKDATGRSYVYDDYVERLGGKTIVVYTPRVPFNIKDVKPEHISIEFTRAPNIRIFLPTQVIIDEGNIDPLVIDL